MALLAIPVSLVEPLKLAPVAIAGAGHWIAGTATVVCAYAVSLTLVERLFKIVKPKLISLPLFARLWSWFLALGDGRSDGCAECDSIETGAAAERTG